MKMGLDKPCLMQETANDRTHSNEFPINSEATKYPLTRKVRRGTRVPNRRGHAILEEIGDGSKLPRNAWNEEFPTLGNCDWKGFGVPKGTMVACGDNLEDAENGPEEVTADLAGEVHMERPE